MLFIKELNPQLNTQKDSIRAKLFMWLFVQILYYHYIFSLFICVSKEFFNIYIRSHFTHYWLDNDVKWTWKRRHIFKLLDFYNYNIIGFLDFCIFYIGFISLIIYLYILCRMHVDSSFYNWNGHPA